MRHLLTIGLVLLSATSALAQVPPSPQPQPQQHVQPQQLSDNYYSVPAYVPQQAAPVYAQPAPVAHPAPAAPSADYGSSVMTDIRQMNF
ncbi:MAG: hypothetical protein V4735_03440 [Pseudomonadota bacterium]